MPLPKPANSIPSFLRRRKDTGRDHDTSSAGQSPENSFLSTVQRSRNAVVRDRILRSLLYLIALIFIILVELGSTSDRAVLRQTYFLKIDLSDIIPLSVPDSALINSIARSIGLHDFYQVGLWNFCEGYEDGSGITFCSRPQKMYAFNPVDILMNELLAGATIALPGEITYALNIARIASHWMFALFIVAAVLSFLCIFLTPFSVPPTTTTPTSSTQPDKKPTFKTPVSKKLVLPLTILSFLTFFVTLAASLVATALFTIFKIVFTSNAEDLNITAELGVHMLVFMWLATACVGLGFVMHCYELCSCCCCCFSRRQRRRRKAKKLVVEMRQRPDTSTGTRTPATATDADADADTDADADSAGGTRNGVEKSPAEKDGGGGWRNKMHGLGRLGFG